MPAIAPYDEITTKNVMTPEEIAKKADMTNIVKNEGEHAFEETPTKG